MKRHTLKNHTFIRLLKLAWPIKHWMALAALLGSLTVASGIGLLATSAYLISAAALHPSVAALQVAIVGVRFFGIARGVFRYLERMVSHRATFRLLSNLRVWFYTALEPLIPARLIADKEGELHGLRSGDLLRRVVADIDVLQNFYIRIVAPPVVAMIVGLAVWFFLGAFSPLFTLAYIVFFLLASVGVPLLTYLLSNRLGRELVATRAELHSHLVDSIQGIADLVAFGQEERQAVQISALNDRLNRMQMAMASISGLQGMLSNLLMNVTAWVMLLIALPLVSTGHLNGIFLAVVVLSTLASFEVVVTLPGAFQQVGGSLAAAQRLFDVVDAPPAIKNPVEPASILPAQRFSFEIEQLHFRYNPAEPYVLQHITMSIPAGQCIALVGASGSGKSTLARLLLRFWDYQEGHIRLLQSPQRNGAGCQNELAYTNETRPQGSNGSTPVAHERELKSFQQDELYAQISVVEQDTHLFNTTIRENLLLARPESTYEEMVEAAKQAQLHDFVQTLPAGYDTQVGEEGLRLSGGERQRVAIARAFLKDAPILILDEPTVNLDAITERAVLQALRSLCRGRTTLMVAHRLAELDMASEIYVLQQGQIVEHGKQAELLKARGSYWHLWQQQQSMAVAAL